MKSRTQLAVGPGDTQRAHESTRRRWHARILSAATVTGPSGSSGKSIAMARESGDASALLFPLRLTQMIPIDWETADRQLEFHREAVALAAEIGDPDLVLDTKALMLIPLDKLGEIAEIETLLASLR